MRAPRSSPDIVHSTLSFLPSHWPSTPARTRRLLDFQASELFRERPTTLSPFWIVHGAATFVVPQPSKTTVFAGFAFGGPGERLSVRPVPGPAGLWRRAGRVATRVAAATERKEAEALRERARRAFSPGPVLDGTLSALPPFAELAATRPNALAVLLRYSTYLNEIVPRAQGVQRTLEIGSGAGLVSLGLHRLLGSQSILVDLPEMLAVAYPLLAHYEGEDAITLPHEVGDSLPDTPYVMLTPSQARLVADTSVGLALNTDSFQEMTYAAIGGYFELVQRVLAPGGLFYCVNEENCTKIEGQPIEFDRYPWPAAWETAVDRPYAYSRAVTGHRHRERISRVPGGLPGAASAPQN